MHISRKQYDWLVGEKIELDFRDGAPGNIKVRITRGGETRYATGQIQNLMQDPAGNRYAIVEQVPGGWMARMVDATKPDVAANFSSKNEKEAQEHASNFIDGKIDI